ncbi:gem-associated protein 8 isoform X2 [Trachypithecus francoisi]|nr:gem-associated protein 8 isoform X2 [Trachypithecus francoisi]XP_033057040.1 gem-associated protein 8 isoform X2 [Trachypithecus francoisi]XP_033057041.1 gem-associated protein 8 isoform X2 [Trachypithecus francoisi]
MAAVKASTSKATRPWYSHPVYARYWQHYHQAMAWMQSHHNAYRKAVESCFSLPWYFPPALLPQSSYDNQAAYPQSFYDHHLAWQDYPCSSSHFGRSGQHPHYSSRIQASTREDQALSKEEEMETESDAEVECDLSNMEITEELRQYFAETERHREERRRQQQLDAERLDSYVNADHDLYCNTRRSIEAPTERPGERRQAEMKRLYGDSAAKIQAMEAAVQLSFDKHCDRKQPKYWPVIPLKF